MDLTEKQLREIERQLSHPKGEMGIEVALNMNVSNKAMTSGAIEFMHAQSGDHVLEIGHGNCAHLPEVFASAEKIHYTGLEISETMHSEAKRINKIHIENKLASFVLYDGNTLPFTDEEFDKVFTVNTLYFWEKPAAFLNEIHRVLKPKGVCIIAFGKKEFLTQMPFVKSRFNLYGNEELQALVNKSHFNSLEIEEREDAVINKVGKSVLRKFGIAVLRK